MHVDTFVEFCHESCSRGNSGKLQVERTFSAQSPSCYSILMCLSRISTLTLETHHIWNPGYTPHLAPYPTTVLNTLHIKTWGWDAPGSMATHTHTTHTHTHTHTHTYTHTHSKHTQTQTHRCVHTQMHTYTQHTCTHTHKYTADTHRCIHTHRYTHTFQ